MKIIELSVHYKVFSTLHPHDSTLKRGSWVGRSTYTYVCMYVYIYISYEGL